MFKPNIGMPKTFNFPFGTNGKLMVLGVPKLKHVWIIHITLQCAVDQARHLPYRQKWLLIEIKTTVSTQSTAINSVDSY